MPPNETHESKEKENEWKSIPGAHATFIILQKELSALTATEREQLQDAAKKGYRKYDYGEGVVVVKLSDGSGGAWVKSKTEQIPNFSWHNNAKVTGEKDRILYPISAKKTKGTRWRLVFRRTSCNPQQLVCVASFRYDESIKDLYHTTLVGLGLDLNEEDRSKRKPYWVGFPCSDDFDQDDFGERQKYRNTIFSIKNHKQVKWPISSVE